MQSKLKHIGLVIACLLIILLLLSSFAIGKDYKKARQDLQNCPCEEGEFCRDGTCVASNPDNEGTMTQNGIGNKAGITLSAAVAEDNCGELRNCVKDRSELYNCTYLLNLKDVKLDESKTKSDTELCYCDGNLYLPGRFVCMKGSLHQCSNGSWINAHEMCSLPLHPLKPMYEPTPHQI